MSSGLTGDDGGLGSCRTGGDFTRTRSEYTVTDLTNRTVPALAGQYEPGLRLDLGTGVGDRDGPPDDGHRGEVVHVVADVRDPCGVEVVLGHPGPQGAGLVLDTVHDLHLQLVGT